MLPSFLRPGEAGTLDLWELLPLPGIWSHDCVATQFYGPDFPHQSLPRSDAGEAIGGAVLPFIREFAAAEYGVSRRPPARLLSEFKGASRR